MIGDRLRSLMLNKACTYTALAKAVGVSITTVRKWVTNDTKSISGKYLVAIANYFGVNPTWLETGEGPIKGSNVIAVEADDEINENEYVKVYESRVVFGCGEGCEPTYEEIHDGDCALYKASYFRHKRVNPRNCIRFRIQGDSMAPFINEGDYVLVDLSDNKDIISNKIYAIGVQGNMRVKRLFKSIDGGLEIRSDNSTYKTEYLTPEQVEEYNVRIVGRVIDRTGDAGF